MVIYGIFMIIATSAMRAMLRVANLRMGEIELSLVERQLIGRRRARKKIETMTW